MIDTTKLRELANKATAGPWSKRGEYISAADGSDVSTVFGVEEHSLEYVAAANPATVLALLDELTRTQGSVAIASAALSAAEREVQRLRTIEAAARNLVKVKGRHNSEIAYQRLVEVLG